jgi:hypothetical protein
MTRHSFIQSIAISSASSKISFLDYGSKLSCRDGWLRQYKYINDEIRRFSPVKAFCCESIHIISSGDTNIIADNLLEPITLNQINLDYVINTFYKRLNTGSIDKTSSTFLESVQDKAIILTGHAPRQWGHFLAELLPRVLIIKDLLTRNNSTPLYISRSTPNFVIEAIKSVLKPVSAEIRFFDEGITFFRNAIIPQYLNYGPYLGFHPYVYDRMAEVISLIKSQNAINTAAIKYPEQPKKLYISRLHDGSYKPLTAARPIVNEREIIDIMDEAGFKVVRMEDYSFIEKIELLSDVSILAGGFGSGLNNSFLTLSKPLVICIGLPFNSAQHDICDCMHQRLVDIPTYDLNDSTLVVEKAAGISTAANLSLLVEINHLACKDIDG